ncbi:MAG: hypothetical protein JRH13_14205 [Deltaproteobacteria bacterium]|nr:hypothetical protein [Deltaproteobacteria bacterium]MBW2016154.1 hypothetical protein [Deltaproteobacteria bacterium]MBW2130504.1 hypothetical protein [Deltaproteobacteria bacterium]MBW2302550.1 hypothetical protein [Deltaproteobacteria bacterium]
MIDKDMQDLYDYLAELGRTYDELMDTLKLCVELLSGFKPMMPDPERWQAMLDMLEGKIKIGEKMTSGWTLR